MLGVRASGPWTPSPLHQTRASILLFLSPPLRTFPHSPTTHTCQFTWENPPTEIKLLHSKLDRWRDSSIIPAIPERKCEWRGISRALPMGMDTLTRDSWPFISRTCRSARHWLMSRASWAASWIQRLCAQARLNQTCCSCAQKQRVPPHGAIFSRFSCPFSTTPSQKKTLRGLAGPMI